MNRREFLKGVAVAGASFAAAHGWTMLLHLGALRDTSARLRAAAGPVGGFAGMRLPVDPAAVAAAKRKFTCWMNRSAA